MLNTDEGDWDSEIVENIQAEFNRRNSIQNTDNKSYRLFLEQLYKYKYTLKKDDLDLSLETLNAPDINNYDFDKEIDLNDLNLTISDYD